MFSVMSLLFCISSRFKYRAMGSLMSFVQASVIDGEAVKAPLDAMTLTFFMHL